jgi:hypothetical protein
MHTTRTPLNGADFVLRVRAPNSLIVGDPFPPGVIDVDGVLHAFVQLARIIRIVHVSHLGGPAQDIYVKTTHGDRPL